MSFKQVQCVYWSPTGTTRKILETVAENMSLNKMKSVDLTRPLIRDQFEGELKGDLILVGTSVYGGSIPSMILEPLNKLKGEGKWAIPIAVYGTRSPEACLEEMSGLLRTREFKILAAANFVAEHSFVHDDAPAGKGRPNEEDLKIAANFGEKIVEKMNSNPVEIPIESKPLKNGENYKREEWPEIRTGQLMKAHVHDEEKCIKCNKCVESCPTAAIEPETYMIDYAKCFTCTACLRVCPTNAKTITWPSRVTEFMNKWEWDKNPEIFI